MTDRKMRCETILRAPGGRAIAKVGERLFIRSAVGEPFRPLTTVTAGADGCTVLDVERDEPLCLRWLSDGSCVLRRRSSAVRYEVGEPGRIRVAEAGHERRLYELPGGHVLVVVPRRPASEISRHDVRVYAPRRRQLVGAEVLSVRACQGTLTAITVMGTLRIADADGTAPALWGRRRLQACDPDHFVIAELPDGTAVVSPRCWAL